MQKFDVNTITRALIEQGFIQQIVDAPFHSPDSYEFGLDDMGDAKLMPRVLRTAYTAVVGAALREDGQQGPIFDEEDELESTSAPEDRNMDNIKPISLEQAKIFAAAAYRVALSQGRHEDCAWLVQMTKREVLKDADGQFYVSKSTVNIIKPFDEWLVDQLAETPQDSTWFASILNVRQLGVSVDNYMGIDEAKSIFNEWLNEVPWTRDGKAETRRERIVGQVADRKWENFKLSLLTGNRKKIEKALEDWNIMVHSSRMALEVIGIKANPFYKMHLIDLAQEAEERQLMNQELELRMMEIKINQQERKEKFDALTESFNARLAKLSSKVQASEPVETVIDVPAKSRKPNVVVNKPARA